MNTNSGPIGNLDANEGRFLKWDTTKPTAATPALYQAFNLNTILNGDHRPADVFRGAFETIDDEGRLVVRTAEGSARAIAAGDVHFGLAATAG